MSFDEFVARKEAEAARAAVSPFVTEVRPPTGGCHRGRQRVDAADVRRAVLCFIARAFTGSRQPTSLVFVRSRDGNTGATDPSSLGGGEADKHLIYEGLSRVAADAVMAAPRRCAAATSSCQSGIPNWSRCATSLRLPRHPIQIVATLRGLDVARPACSTSPELRVVVVTVGACAELMITPVAQSAVDRRS